MGTRTLLDRLDAAVVSCAVKLWPELLDALALAGQCAGGMRCFPQVGEQATSTDLPARVATGPMADQVCATDVAAANGTPVLSVEETARGLPDARGSTPKGAGRHRPCPVSLGREAAAGDTPDDEAAQP